MPQTGSHWLYGTSPPRLTHFCIEARAARWLGRAWSTRFAINNEYLEVDQMREGWPFSFHTNKTSGVPHRVAVAHSLLSCARPPS